MLYEKYRHSAAAGNCWLESVSAFIWRWGLENFLKEEKPRMAMGKAAEEAAYAGLMMGLSIREIARYARDRFDFYMEGEITPERSYAVRCAVRAYKALQPLGKPLDYQPWRPIHLLGEMQREISIKPDFVYPDFIVDLKCTTKMPSEASATHTRQGGLYASAYQKPVLILYITPTRRPQLKPLKTGPRKGTIPLAKLAEKRTTKWFLIDRQTAAVTASELLTAFKQIERWDGKFGHALDAIPFAPLNQDSFYWSDPQDAATARDLWERVAA